MGVLITATHSKYSFDTGAFGFFNLRKNIAIALDEEFGKHYEKLIFCHTKEDYDIFDRVTNRMAARLRLDFDILDFLFASDVEGSVSYKTCKKIYELIKDIDFGTRGFRYGAYQHNDYEEFKLFLKECYRYKRKMRWY